jgi:hypothetical protein
MSDAFLDVDWVLQDFMSPAEKAKLAKNLEAAGKPAPSRPILTIKSKKPDADASRS